MKMFSNTFVLIVSSRYGSHIIIIPPQDYQNLSDQKIFFCRFEIHRIHYIRADSAFLAGESHPNSSLVDVLNWPLSYCLESLKVPLRSLEFRDLRWATFLGLKPLIGSQALIGWNRRGAHHQIGHELLDQTRPTAYHFEYYFSPEVHCCLLRIIIRYNFILNVSKTQLGSGLC